MKIVPSEKWLRYFWIKTAPVRWKVKPGALLFLKNSQNSCGDILEFLQLDYLVLKSDASGRLVLFYDQMVLSELLSARQVQIFLRKYGYDDFSDPAAALAQLKIRFQEHRFAHEIGVFIGYPVKDVAGFIYRLPRTAVSRGDWAVFGNAVKSIRQMQFYRRVESIAGLWLEQYESLHFMKRISDSGLLLDEAM